ncbi:signal peptidase I [Natronococcus roseus]|uniref:signal peptidase I n=1 Tax=Natronococcus roseus TaxID=1052014 RepID=UPI00374CDEE8
MSTQEQGNARRYAKLAAIGAVAVVLLAIVAGHLLGVPIALSYVETGSMEPTIETGDGFVAVPTAVAGPVEEGDVIVFDAQEIEGGGLTTHRVVEVTDQGYVTQGDANPFPDQDSGEPLVTDGQVVATALEVDGEPVTVPHLGSAVMGVESGLESGQQQLASTLGTTAVLGTQGLSYLLLAFGLVVLGASLALERRSGATRERTRERSRADVYDARTLVVGLAALLVVVSLATMVAMSGTTETGIVSAEFDSDRPDVIPAGETESHEYELYNGGLLPTVTIVEPASEGVAVGERTTLGYGENETATVAYTAPPETGYYLRSVSERTYFAVLPEPAIATLHAIHPWAAMASVTAVLTGIIVAPLALLVGTGTIRTRSRSRSRSPGGVND